MVKEKRLTWTSNCLNATEFEAHNQKGECVGALHYERLGAFMHWLWYQTQGFFMSAGCLDEVRQKQKELLKWKQDKGSLTK